MATSDSGGQAMVIVRNSEGHVRDLMVVVVK